MSTPLVKLLSMSVGLTPTDVMRIISSAPRRYKEFLIPKNNGRGHRKIAQPSREVKLLQRALCESVLTGFPVHNAAHGYVRGRGIRTNAEAHQSANFILKMDFENFFPSMKPNDLRLHLQMYASTRFDENEVRQLELILFWLEKGSDSLRMCIGAPSSPMLSNTFLYSIDAQLTAVCDKSGVTYTRYADDLTFSSSEPNLLKEIQNETELIIGKADYPKLKINKDKTIHISKRQRRTVTGINITPSGKLSIGRGRKRLMRSMAHRHSQGILSTEDQKMLGGLIAFAADIDPGLAVDIKLSLLNHPPLAK
ncbi:retron St85 family RNA-directed DNA polymerase [Xanthomonas hortorum]|uniref:retron St85 family RNA-directed DNA polymerase n=1 Tax=Xanthomonas hortorum TaxID=56454 RepID=UPI001594A189|nr:retron St85 family RNA-directed DNA polymerase [Xanthomonas hortorum]NHF66826.1 RNA-directed DNA polymerase [Xanthomonas hortorum]